MRLESLPSENTFNDEYLFSIDLQLFASAEDEGRTEEPSEYKKRKSREEGKVAKSQELVSVIILLFSFWTLALAGEYLFNTIIEMMNEYLGQVNTFTINDGNIGQFVTGVILYVMKLCAPIFIVTFLCAFLANVVQTGLFFTAKPLKPEYNKISFTANKMFSKIFMSKQTMMNLFKSLFKVGVVGLITYFIIIANLNNFIKMTTVPPAKSFSNIMELTFTLVNAVGVLFLVLGFLDFLFQKKEYIESLKMTKHELKEERKDTEGDPYIKQRLREKQRELMSRRMMEDVPKADVVITNPTHFAIALKYDEYLHNAPVCIAKGKDLIALKIIKIAKENGIHCYEDKPLAHSLYASVEIGEEIPFEFYKAIAEVLAFIIKLKKNIRV